MWPGWSPVSAETTALFAILDRYFIALENGIADQLRPDPRYKWRYYQGDMTIERMRTALAEIDAYLWDQRSWVEGQARESYDAGPDLSRMPDAMMVAMFQEVDSLFAQSL